MTGPLEKTEWKVPTQPELCAGGAICCPSGKHHLHKARVVGRVSVNDVELAPGEKFAELPNYQRMDGVERLGAVAVPAVCTAHANDFERWLSFASCCGIDDARRATKVPGDDGNFVAALLEAAGLSVDVFGNATEGRVVVIRNNRDFHEVLQPSQAVWGRK